MARRKGIHDKVTGVSNGTGTEPQAHVDSAEYQKLLVNWAGLA
jgi:hypothetical protein